MRIVCSKMNFRHSTEKLEEEIGESESESGPGPGHAMSYHRSGQTGAVAVSYSTSPMPHSPNRRYSTGTGSGSTATSGIGSTTSKFNTYRSSVAAVGTSSLLDRPTTSFYSSSSAGLHSNYSEYRRSYCAPSRLVSSLEYIELVLGTRVSLGNARKLPIIVGSRDNRF